MKKFLYLLLAVCLLSGCHTEQERDSKSSDTAEAPIPQETAEDVQKPRTVSITALGDSITRGFGLPQLSSERFTALLGEEIKQAGMVPKIANYGVDGIKSDGLLAELEEGYYTSVKATEFITLCIGANNILGAGFSFLEDASGLEGDALIRRYEEFREAADDGCEQLEKDLPQILEEIGELNPKGSVILLTLYNPYAHIEVSLDSIEEGMTVASLTDEYIQKINGITKAYSDEVAAVADVYAAFSGWENELVWAYTKDGDMVNMDPHPNPKGHEVIAEALWEVMNGLLREDGTR